jgi:hypothetical protein
VKFKLYRRIGHLSLKFHLGDPSSSAPVHRTRSSSVNKMQAAAKSYSTSHTPSQAVAMSSSSRRHGGRHRAEPPSHSPAPSEPRDWAALPQDILITVFLKLGPREIMLGAEFVWTTWRRAAVGEALLWRRIDLTSFFHPARSAMVRAALDRSAGQCEAFCGSCDSEMLLYLVGRYGLVLCLSISRVCFHF